MCLAEPGVPKKSQVEAGCPQQEVKKMLKMAGGVTVPQGFCAAGMHVGLKRKRKDLAILSASVPCTAAAVFTTNVVKGAPVLWSKSVLTSGKLAKAIVVNSGHANSCTGPEGNVHAEQMAVATAKQLGCDPDQVFVASTGYIGVPIPIDKIVAGIPQVANALSFELSGGTAAAEAIKTTDSFTKEIAFQFQLGGKTVRIGAMGKGSGMVHPNMATMLSFITTDANIDGEVLQTAMRDSVGSTYNMISVDGDTSTNDMCIVMASGLAGNKKIESMDDPDYAIFKSVLHKVNEFMAKAIARDGEGATKFLEVSVLGSENQDDARKLAKTVVSSSLVKTALFGQDANWGRIIAALGRGGVQFDPSKLSIKFESEAGQLSLMHTGTPIPFEVIDAQKILGEKDIRISIDLMAGASEARAWGCDLSLDYVRINGAYRS